MPTVTSPIRVDAEPVLVVTSEGELHGHTLAFGDHRPCA